MKRNIILALLLSILFVLNSCNMAISFNKSNNIDVYSIVNALASNEMEGRLTGTQGNKKAEKYIQDYFESIGLVKYSRESYLFPYEHTFYDQDKQQYLIKILFNDGKVKECIYGKDFLPQSLSQLHLHAPVVVEPNDQVPADSIVLLENQADCQKYYNKCKGILLKKSVFKKTLKVYDSVFPIIQINDELFELLKNKSNSRVEIQYDLKAQEITANNIIGKIEGKDKETALVLSAHFDHVGKDRDTIYLGAIDNSTGVALLLELAQKIMEYSRKHTPATDIVICAFNGEESGRQGSKAFVEDIKKRYKNIININLDCIGIKDGGQLLIAADSTTSSLLMDNMEQYFKSKGLDCIVEGQASYESDHLSFSEAGIPSISLGQSNLHLIHTLEDNIEKIDFEFIQSISQELYQYILNDYVDFIQAYELQKEQSNYTQNNHKSQQNAIDKDSESYLENEEKALKPGQYKLIEKGEERYLIYNTSMQFTSIDDLNTSIKAAFPQQLLGYSFKEAEVVFIPPEVDTQNIEVGKVYNSDLFGSEFHYIGLHYYHEQDREEELIINLSKMVNDEPVSMIANHQGKKQTVTINSLDYIIYLSDLNEIVGIETTIRIKDDLFVINLDKSRIIQTEINGQIMNLRKPSWTKTSPQGIAKFIESLNIEKVLKDALAGSES